jgi:polyhydroxybutyrate depolymerase
VPAGYDAQKATPLVLLLHGYSASGAVQKVYFDFGSLADSVGFLLAYPDGTLDHWDHQFWNATDACCNQDGSSVDDVAYLRAVVHDMKRRYNVDPRRVFVVGHSNGGFMGYRLACDFSEEIAAVVSLAGATWKDSSRCHPSAPVSILEIHGDADETVSYQGGAASPPLVAAYPSAHDTLAAWAHTNGCSGTLSGSGARLDLVSSLPGAETRLEQYQGCSRAAATLWTIEMGGHLPVLQPTFGPSVYGFLNDHPKP